MTATNVLPDTALRAGVAMNPGAFAILGFHAILVCLFVAEQHARLVKIVVNSSARDVPSCGNVRDGLASNIGFADVFGLVHAAIPQNRTAASSGVHFAFLARLL